MSEFSVVESVDGPGCSGASVLGYPGMLLWFSLCVYLFCGMFVLCEEYFIPALTVLSWKLGLSDDVSGGTLMALGTSTPELFTALIGIFLYRREDNPGPATNCASAAYNLCVIIGASILFCGRSQLSLNSYAFVRDTLMYGLSLLFLHSFYEVWSPGQIEVWESAILVIHYILYCLILYYQPYVQRAVVSLCDGIGIDTPKSWRLSSELSNNSTIKYTPGLPSDSDLAYSVVGSGNDSLSPIKSGGLSPSSLAGHHSSSVTGASSQPSLSHGLSANPHHNGSQPSTNLHIAGDDDLIGSTFQGGLIRTQSAGSTGSVGSPVGGRGSAEYGSAASGGVSSMDDLRIGGPSGNTGMRNNFSNGTTSASDLRDWHYWKSVFHSLMLPYRVIFELTLVKTHCPADLTTHDPSVHSNIHHNGGVLTVDSTATTAPIRRSNHSTALSHFDLDDSAMADPPLSSSSLFGMDDDDDVESASLLQLEVGSLTNHQRESLSLIGDRNDTSEPVSSSVMGETEVMSDMKTVLQTMTGVTVWLFVLSYLAMDLANKIGVCLNINADVMGISLLAIGSSLPDTFSSVLVARQGKGSMAVSNAMGSNIFDICICVGLPFLLKSLFQNGGHSIQVESDPAFRLFLLALLFLLMFLCVLMHKDRLILRPKHGWILIVAYVIYLLVFCNVLNRAD